MNLKRIIACVAVLAAACCLCPVALGSSSAPNVTVSVSGLKTTFTKSASTTIEDQIQVVHSHPGTLKVQRYNTSTSKWQTKATYELVGDEVEQVTITYPEQWKNKFTTTWRITIPAVEGYDRYISPTVTITATNIELELNSKAAAIYNVDDNLFVYNKKATRQLANASTTKMLTALVILEEDQLDSYATYSRKAKNTDYGILDAKKGTKIKVSNLLKSLLISSSNDSAVCLAEFSAGSVRAFASKMNAKAAELGCGDTNFVNPHGLTEKGHHSSAQDLCIIQTACLEYPEYRKIISTKKWRYKDKAGKQTFSGESTNKLLGNYEGFLGGKTGYTDAAGNCFSGVFTYNDKTYVFTTLGATSSDKRWTDAKRVVSYIKKHAA